MLDFNTFVYKNWKTIFLVIAELTEKAFSLLFFKSTKI